jgi:hypothetical protein
MSENLVPEDDDPRHEPVRGEDSLIRDLRGEAYQVRDCFTRYAFQSLAAASGLAILILRFQVERKELGYTVVFPLIVLFAVIDMGLHKYATSNRLLGYELYLYRLRHYTTADKFHQNMRSVGWEEAMRAWRVVNGSLFDALYRQTWRKPWPWGFSPIRRKSHGSAWFAQAATLKDRQGVSYASGAYIRSLMNAFIALIALISLDLIYTTVYASYHYNWLASVALGICTLLWVTITIARLLHISSRITILEDEFRSIHSCSIAWEATILAHFLALLDVNLLRLDRTSPAQHHGYTRALGERTYEILQSNTMELHDWIAKAREKVFNAMSS